MTAFYARAVHDACIAFRRMHTSGDYARWTTWGGFLAAPAGKDLGSLSREDMVYVPYPGMYCGYDWDAEACQGRNHRLPQWHYFLNNVYYALPMQEFLPPLTEEKGKE